MIIWNKIKYVGLIWGLCEWVWAVLGILFVETFIGSFGCDSWARKIKVSMGEVGFEKRKSCNFKGIRFIIAGPCWWTLRRIARRRLNRNVMVNSRKCVCDVAFNSSLPCSELKSLLLKCWHWGGGEIYHPYPALNISHDYTYPRWVFWLRCSTFGIKWEIVGPVPFSLALFTLQLLSPGNTTPGMPCEFFFTLLLPRRSFTLSPQKPARVQFPGPYSPGFRAHVSHCDQSY